MNFLVDAQLPGRLASFLAEAGHDPVHTTQLPLWVSLCNRSARPSAEPIPVRQ